MKTFLDPVGGSRVPVQRKNSDDSDCVSDVGPGKLANQFSYIERATQTPVRACHEVNIQTEPPARANFTQTVNQWVIFDFYQKYETKKEVEEKTELEDILKSASSSATNRKKPNQVRLTEESAEVRMLKSAKILERMVNLNTFDEIAQDFRFWEDASDEFKAEWSTLIGPDPLRYCSLIG